jgi:hypothetical protein
MRIEYKNIIFFKQKEKETIHKLCSVEKTKNVCFCIPDQIKILITVFLVI